MKTLYRDKNRLATVWKTLIFNSDSCGQMLPAVWNVAKPLEVEYKRPIHQSSDQSNTLLEINVLQGSSVNPWVLWRTLGFIGWLKGSLGDVWVL